VGVQLSESFTIQAPVDQVWDYFQDPQRVAKCVPGADLDQVVNQNHFKGGVKVKMGPVGLKFKGELQVTERNEASKRVVMKAKGAAEGGKGQAEASVTAQLQGSGDTTTVRLDQDINLTGAAAQYGRGMMSDVLSVLIKQFSQCVQSDLSGKGPTAKSSMGGMGLMAGSTKAGLKRIFGGGKKE